MAERPIAPRAEPIIIRPARSGVDPITIIREMNHFENWDNVFEVLTPEILATCRTVWYEAAPIL